MATVTAQTTEPKALTHFVNGQRVAGQSNRFGDVFDPSTG